jgi:hypothetical protein
MKYVSQPQPVVGHVDSLTNPYDNKARDAFVHRKRAPSLSIPTSQLHQWVNVQRLPIRDIEHRSGMCRQSIIKRLKQSGQFVPRKQAGGAPGVHITVNCYFCQREIRKRTKLARKVMRNFCNEDCYYAQIAMSGYNPWRQGSRIARALVAQRFALDKDHIVHHKDGDQRNNDVSNLAVYASNAEHMAHHRGRTVLPLWDGAQAT